MTDKEQKKTKENKPWFFVRFFKWSGQKFKNAVSWLFPGKQEFPANETGELMRRTLANKSWFDKISSSWVGLSFWKQFLAVSGATLVAGLVGLLASASVLFLCSALILSITCHVMFVAHENHRTKSAKTSAKEHLELQKDLEKGKELLENSVKAIDPVAAVLEEETTRVKAQADGLAEEAAALKEHVETIGTKTHDLTLAAEQFDAQTKAVQAEHDGFLNGIRDLGVVVDTAKKKIEAIGDAAVTLHEATQDFQRSQQQYSVAASRYVLFVGERLDEHKKKASDTSKTLSEQENDEFDADTERLIAEIKARQALRMS